MLTVQVRVSLTKLISQYIKQLQELYSSNFRPKFYFDLLTDGGIWEIKMTDDINSLKLKRWTLYVIEGIFNIP